MIRLGYKPSFIKQLNHLEHDLQEEALEKIELFKDPANHKMLNVHKLKGSLADCYSFYVNYKIRIVFQYLSSKSEAVLLGVGDHDAYK